jgi:hypothetical protein
MFFGIALGGIGVFAILFLKGNVVSDFGGCDHYGTPNIIKF